MNEIQNIKPNISDNNAVDTFAGVDDVVYHNTAHCVSLLHQWRIKKKKLYTTTGVFIVTTTNFIYCTRFKSHT